jgi:hypothetical protein
MNDGTRFGVYQGRSGHDGLAPIVGMYHGALAPPEDIETSRLEALLGVGKCSLQLLRDIATFWWGSVLMWPTTIARSGKPHGISPPSPTTGGPILMPREPLN